MATWSTLATDGAGVLDPEMGELVDFTMDVKHA